MCRLTEEEALKIESWIYFAFNLKIWAFISSNLKFSKFRNKIKNLPICFAPSQSKNAVGDNDL